MKNYVQEGDHITVVAPAAVLSGAPVLIGSLFGIATTDAAAGAEVALKRRGVFTLPKTNAQAWTVGAKINWDVANKVATTAAGTLIGVAAADAVNPSATGSVLLDGAIR